MMDIRHLWFAREVIISNREPRSIRNRWYGQHARQVQLVAVRDNADYAPNRGCRNRRPSPSQSDSWPAVLFRIHVANTHTTPTG